MVGRWGGRRRRAQACVEAGRGLSVDRTSLSGVALALYRKYRPATFAEVVGQEHVTEPLMQALSTGRINHAYLFSGPRGCGKTSSARILARSLNCETRGPTPDPCGKCDSCVALAPDGPGSLDVIEIDAASHGGVDDARDLRERAFFAPVSSRYKVYIVDEAHMVSTQGFNALLKLVEEPPEFLVFVFATTEPEKVLPTIRSRTHHYPFRLIPPGVMRGLLAGVLTAEGIEYEPSVLPLVVRAGGGSARDALSVLDQLIAGSGPDGVRYATALGLLGVTDGALLDEIVDALAAGDAPAVYETVDRVVEAGHDPRRFAGDLLERLRDLVVLDVVPDANAKGLLDCPPDQVERMTDQAARLGTATLSRLADIVHNGLVEMRGTTSPRLLLELVSARMLLPAASTDGAALLQRLERLERRLSLTAPAPDVSTPPAARRPRDDVRTAGGADEAGGARSAGNRAGGERSGGGRGIGDRAAGEAATGAPVADAGEPATRESAAGERGAGQRGAGRGGGGRSGGSAGSAAGVGATSGASPRTPEGGVGSKGDAGEEAGADRAAGSRPTDGSVDDAAPVAEAPADAAPERQIAVATDVHDEPSVPPVPDAAAVAPPVGEMNAAALRRIWPEVLDAVKRRRRTAHALLMNVSVHSVEGGTLTLTISSEPLSRLLTQDVNTDVVRAAVKDVLGVDWRVRVQVDGGALVEGTPAGSSAAVDDDPRDDEPVEAGDAPEPARRADPEEAAISLLESTLGARRMDGEQP
jgi:DNA polymerase III subunit gamma/tau